MKHYQDMETGDIYAFEDDHDPIVLSARNMPSVLSEIVKPKPDDSYIWYEDGWIMPEQAPPGYINPVSSVPSYNPAWVAHLHPYTAVHRDQNSGLEITLDQINENSYDGARLAHVVASLPLGTPSGIPALISYDGGIAIPQCEDFPTRADGINKLNELLCSFLLGGIHAEIISSEALVAGFLKDEATLFAGAPGLHSQLRSNMASIIDRLEPLMYPRVLMTAEIQAAYGQGQRVIAEIQNLSPFFLLNGYSAMVYRNTSDALNNLWIAVEQITEYLWVQKYLKDKATFSAAVASVHAKLKKERRLDTISAKHELLNLSNIISSTCFNVLEKSRRKRNDLAHEGIVPSSEVVGDLWRVIPDLLEESSGVRSLGIRKLGGVGEYNWAIPLRTNFDEWKELSIKL
ncbi:hypothetical protein [Pseudomonas sp.]|uniref:hypothetical protein n=1 Tax=Pseudomonas sp. TaxID=306 RepID=UPI003C4BE180